MQAKKFGILGNPAKAGAKEKLAELLDLLHARGAKECYVSSEFAGLSEKKNFHSASPLQIAASSEIIFSLGGDGTMLTSARSIMRANPSVELLRINLGKLGFIAENSPEELPNIIEELWTD